MLWHVPERFIMSMNICHRKGFVCSCYLFVSLFTAILRTCSFRWNIWFASNFFFLLFKFVVPFSSRLFYIRWSYCYITTFLYVIYKRKRLCLSTDLFDTWDEVGVYRNRKWIRKRVFTFSVRCVVRIVSAEVNWAHREKTVPNHTTGASTEETERGRQRGKRERQSEWMVVKKERGREEYTDKKTAASLV